MARGRHEDAKMSMDDLSTADLTAAAPSGSDAGATQPTLPAAPAADFELGAHDLATQLVGKLCHDFISPAGAIISGLDLLEDPAAQDMRADALQLISASARKLVTLVHFARVAFGAATSSESFSAAQLRVILADVYETMRAELDFTIPGDIVFEKPAARALLNLGLIAGNALPVGGTARLELTQDDGRMTLTSVSNGPRARLKAEAIEGLKGQIGRASCRERV